MVRTATLAALAFLLCLALGGVGAWLYQEYAAYRQMQALFPQIVNVINPHEGVLQKITGAPTLQAPAPPASGAGSGAAPPVK